MSMSKLPSLLCERPSLFARKKMIPRNVILKRIFEVVVSSPRGLIPDRLRNPWVHRDLLQGREFSR